MNATKTQKTTEETTTTARGFGKLPCPRCGEITVISISLENLEGDEACQCEDCSTTFSLATIREIADMWAPVLEWLETAPTV